MDEDNRETAKSKDRKGKGVATKDETSSSANGQDGYTNSVELSSSKMSMISKIGASTSKLASDMIALGPKDAYITKALSSSKAGSSGASTGVGANEALTYRSIPAQTDGTFKSTRPHGDHVPRESDFSSFLDGAGMLDSTEPGSIEVHGYEESGNLTTGYTPQATAILATDGMEVVNLLDSGYEELEQSSISLTETEQVALRHRLFGNNETQDYPSQKGQWEDILNFFPASGSNSNGIQEYANLLGTSDLEEARGIWVDQWQRVLSSYTDDVWGDLGSLVNVARDELDSLSTPSGEASPSKSKALRRLQQILTHIRSI